jgi:hypothetical protein
VKLEEVDVVEDTKVKEGGSDDSSGCRNGDEKFENVEEGLQILLVKIGIV